MGSQTRRIALEKPLLPHVAGQASLRARWDAACTRCQRSARPSLQSHNIHRAAAGNATGLGRLPGQASDPGDLKSVGEHSPCGFEPPPPVPLNKGLGCRGSSRSFAETKRQTADCPNLAPAVSAKCGVEINRFERWSPKFGQCVKMDSDFNWKDKESWALDGISLLNSRPR